MVYNFVNNKNKLRVFCMVVGFEDLNKLVLFLKLGMKVLIEIYFGFEDIYVFYIILIGYKIE